MYIYIYVCQQDIVFDAPAPKVLKGMESALRSGSDVRKRESEYWIPRIHSKYNLGGFRRPSEISVGIFGKPFLPFAPADFRREPEPIPRTQVLS